MGFIVVGSKCNPPDKNGVGCVPYEYEIARCAILNAEWCAFLNAVGQKADELGLWHKDMETGVLGGICKFYTSGETPLPRYVPKKGWEKKPVTYVTYTGVMRYCNWLMTGDMEKGAYDLTVTPPRRLEGAKYFLPTDDEWYKAAYYEPQMLRIRRMGPKSFAFAPRNTADGKSISAQVSADWSISENVAQNSETESLARQSLPSAVFRGAKAKLSRQIAAFAKRLRLFSTSSMYWKYPTRSNEIPSQDQANFERGDALAVGAPYYLADVDAYADSASPCGALQMGGNVWEFLEDCFRNPLGNKLRGGSFGYTETGLSSANVDFGKYDKRCYVFGARICQMKDGWRPRRKPLRYVIIHQVRNVIARCKNFVRKLPFCG